MLTLSQSLHNGWKLKEIVRLIWSSVDQWWVEQQGIAVSSTPRRSRSTGARVVRKDINQKDQTTTCHDARPAGMQMGHRAIPVDYDLMNKPSTKFFDHQKLVDSRICERASCSACACSEIIRASSRRLLRRLDSTGA